MASAYASRIASRHARRQAPRRPHPVGRVSKPPPDGPPLRWHVPYPRLLIGFLLGQGLTELPRQDPHELARLTTPDRAGLILVLDDGTVEAHGQRRRELARWLNPDDPESPPRGAS